MVAQKLGFSSVEQLKKQVDRDTIYDWMAVALLQEWVILEQPEQSIGIHDQVDQWLKGSSNTR